MDISDKETQKGERGGGGAGGGGRRDDRVKIYQSFLSVSQSPSPQSPPVPKVSHDVLSYLFQGVPTNPQVGLLRAKSISRAKIAKPS